METPLPPVLLVIFNRPDTTRKVFEAVRAARPPRLYVTADGPRPTKAGEAELVRTCREIATAVDWPCQVFTRFQEENLGCRLAVHGGLSWFFEQEEMGIVLEDDCLPHPDFFTFCHELLYRYRTDDRVQHISGNNWLFGWDTRSQASYYFSRYPYIWGWATWRRVWQRVPADLPAIDEFLENGWIRHVLATPAEARYWQRKLAAVASGRIRSAWSYYYLYALWCNNGLCITPRDNLVTNIGYGTDGGTHTARISTRNRMAFVPACPMPRPLVHPNRLIFHTAADYRTFRNIYSPPLWKKGLDRMLDWWDK